MSFNYPDFLGTGSARARQNSLAPNQGLGLEQPRSPSVHGDSPRGPAPQSFNPSFLNSQVPAFSLNQFSFDGFLQEKLLKLHHDQESPSQSGLAPSVPYDASLPPFNPGVNLDYTQSSLQPLQQPLQQPQQPLQPFQNYSPFGRLGADSFHLPRELQGGIGNISSRRPSYAAESFTRNTPANLATSANSLGSPGSPGTKFGPQGSSHKHSLATLAAANNYSLNSKKDLQGLGQLADSLDGLSLNANFSDFQARRPSQLAEYQPQSAKPSPQPDYESYSPFANPVAAPKSAAQFEQSSMKLENGLMLHDSYILASLELKGLFSSATRYFQDLELSKTIVGNLRMLLANPVIVKLINFIKNANNLTFNHKMLCLVINKNGKLDLLSYPSNSNIYLQVDDLVIVDGDRGKDLVMILEPLVQLDMAILFNFLKKIEHLKSLTILDPNSTASSVKNNHLGGIHPTSMDATKILANHHSSNEDNEFIISLPTKQVLRFATPKEVQRLSAKFLEEKKAFLTCYNKIKELKLENDLTLINVEYQCDFKKLIFYYFAGFKRIDFRGLIKELFKIYKTRIWLCAVLPYDSPELYTYQPKVAKSKEETRARKKDTDGIPPEYHLANEQISKFNLDSFESIPQPNYFHSKNMANLVQNLMHDVKGHFYGFSAKTDTDPERRNSHSIVPSFDPFGDEH